MINKYIFAFTFFTLVLIKEILPISYEIIIIAASICVFFYLKNILTDILFVFFKNTKQNMQGEIRYRTEQALSQLNADNIIKYANLERAGILIYTETFWADFDYQSYLEKNLDILMKQAFNPIIMLYAYDYIDDSDSEPSFSNDNIDAKEESSESFSNDNFEVKDATKENK
jgi:hypothetical protein